jgi:hypothetical protein
MLRCAPFRAARKGCNALAWIFKIFWHHGSDEPLRRRVKKTGYGVGGTGPVVDGTTPAPGAPSADPPGLSRVVGELGAAAGARTAGDKVQGAS